MRAVVRRDRSPRRWLRRLAATTAVAAVVGAGAVVAPVAPAPPAEAAWTSTADAWAKALSASIGAAGKVLGFEKDAGFLYGMSALAITGPLLTLLYNKDSSINDVMSKLGDIDNRIAAIEQTLDVIDDNIREVKVDVLMGTCSVQTGGLLDLLTLTQRAADQYDVMLTKLRSVRDIGGVESLQNETESFIRIVFGAGNTQETAVAATALGSQIQKAHNLLISNGGNYHGVIESCGRANLEEWRKQNAAPAPVAAMGASAPGAWLGEEDYYARTQELVQYWQTVQAQALLLVQEATYLQALQRYATEVAPLTADQAAQACPVYRAGSKSASLCESGLGFARKVRAGFAEEWRQAGVPYTDDAVVLSPGTDVTGLRGPNGAAIPSTIWARDPASFPLQGGTPRTAFPAGTAYDGFTGWAPANAAQWTGLASGLAASHGSFAPKAAPVVQWWSEGYGRNDPFSSVGVPVFAPVDVLGGMGQAKRADGSPQFRPADGLYWIPGQTATFDLQEKATRGGLSFPQGYYLGGTTSVEGKKFLPWYSGPSLSIACMVAPVDGVLCDGPTVGSWWMARQKSVYSVESSNWLTKNYTAVANWSVSPRSGAVPRFEAGGRNSGCSGGAYCGVAMNTGVRAMPPWLLAFTDSEGVVHDPAVEAKGSYTQRVWPALAASAGRNCTTTWGAPSRCGAALDAWLRERLPDPDARVPVAKDAPTVARGSAADTAVCRAPSWQSTTGDGGGALTYGDVAWSAVDGDGRSVTVTKPWGAELSVTDDVLKARNWPTDLDALSVACAVTASFAGEAGTSTVQSDAVPASRIDGGWTVGARLKAAVSDQPDSALVVDDGGTTLSATFDIPQQDESGVVAADAAPDAGAGGEGDTGTSPEPSPAALGSGGAGSRLATSLRPAVDEPVPDTTVTIEWQKREAGATEWVVVDSPSSSSLATRVDDPPAIGRDRLTTELDLAGLGADDHGDAYRVVMRGPDGAEVVTQEATISLASVTMPWLAGLVAAAVVILLLILAIVVDARRRAAGLNGGRGGRGGTPRSRRPDGC